MPIFGWDGSDFDFGRGPVNVEAMVRDLGSPCFVTFKATEGTRVKHVNVGNVLRRARAAGATFVGAYVVPRTPGNNGHGTIPQQVDYLTAYLDQQIPGWRGWDNFFAQVDLEHWSGASGVYDAVAPRYGVEMADLIERLTGKKTILYAPRWAYGDTIGGDHPLWASAYGANPAAHFRAAYPGDNSSRWAGYSGRIPVILQYGSRLTIGSQPGCDANAFRGTLDQLRALITGGQTAMTGPIPYSPDTARAIAVGATSAGFVRATEPKWDDDLDTYNLKAVEGRLTARIDALAVADETRDRAMQAAIDAMAATIVAAGGNVDAAPIVAAVTAVRDEARQQFTSLHEQIAERDAKIADLRAKLAAAAQAQADALKPDAG